MKRRLTLIFIGMMFTWTTWCQVTVTGMVITSNDKEPIIGASIIEQGTTNATVTREDGSFSITVKDTNSRLLVYYLGYIHKEVPVNDGDGIYVALKPLCIRDWFDVQLIGLYFVGGAIHNPVGGKLEIAFPAYFGEGTLTGSLSYQANFDTNAFIQGDVKLKHFIANCGFDMDAAWNYRKIEFSEFNSTTNALEINFNFRGLGIITGFSHLNYASPINRRTFNGPVIGIKTRGPLRLVISGKTALYKAKQEYSAEIQRSSRYIDLFIKYHKLDSFSEISLGIGTIFGYRFKKKRE